MPVGTPRGGTAALAGAFCPRQAGALPYGKNDRVAGDLVLAARRLLNVEAAAFIRECKERDKGIVTPTGQPAVWLDAPMVDVLAGAGTIARELPAMVRQYKRFGIDLIHEPILVYPTLHYQNGGVAIRPDGSTGVPGLFVAGEAAGGAS